MPPCLRLNSFGHHRWAKAGMGLHELYDNKRQRAVEYNEDVSKEGIRLYATMSDSAKVDVCLQDKRLSELVNTDIRSGGINS